VAPPEALNAGSTTRRQTTQKHNKVFVGVEVGVDVLCWLIVVRLLRLLCLLRRNVGDPSWCLGQRYIAGEILKHVDTLGGLADAAWLSLYGEEKPQVLAAEFIEYILQRAEEDMKRLGGSWWGLGEGLLNARGFEKAEVDGVKGEYAITYGRYGTDNKALD
jgi:hypothetical protein